MRSPEEIGMEDLPLVLPVFPLSGALLLPGGELPLYIFERRYRNMVADALAETAVIGMVRPREVAADPVPHGVPLYGIGCAGLITRCREADDGSYALSLAGVCRFRLERELPAVNGYRRVAPDYSPFADDLRRSDETAIDDRDELLLALDRYLDSNGIRAESEGLSDASDEALVTALAMACPLEPREKQALLECPDVTGQASLLKALLEIGAHRAGKATLPH